MFQNNRIGQTSPVVLNLIIINALMLLVTWYLDKLDINIVNVLGLHSYYSSNFGVWQLFTNIFLHGDISHLFFNMFSLWMFGRLLEQVWGGKKFLLYFIATGVGASFLNSLVTIAEIEMMRKSAEEAIANVSPDTLFAFVKSYAPGAKEYANEIISQWNSNLSNPAYADYSKQLIADIVQARIEGGVTIGASGAIYGVLLAFGMLFPNMVLMLIIPPVPIKAKYMVMIFAAIELYLGLSGKQTGIAHFAHLGGMVVGFFIVRYWKRHNLMY